MFIPKKLKYQKTFKGKLKGSTTRGNKIIYGKFALKGLEESRITHLQLETSKKILLKKLKKNGTIWVRIFPNIPVTTKPNENRMGKGKGSVTNWIAKVKKGQIIFEITGVSFELAKKVLNLSSKKLPIKTKFINK
jgi:large subunit ribosomal protein L16